MDYQLCFIVFKRLPFSSLLQGHVVFFHIQYIIIVKQNVFSHFIFVSTFKVCMSVLIEHIILRVLL